ncbi:hypothetical protein [Paenibacillus periandrae]|uniref:hypothetical protein n=1 Tax=Paenibacillus periandrae TaxID=1761741 RepID=UPI001F09BDBF|nr:hypothetical protein [Paenibacillus periandrae]
MKHSTIIATSILTFFMVLTSSVFAATEEPTKTLNLSSISTNQTAQIVSTDAFNGMHIPAVFVDETLYVKADSSAGFTDGRWSMIQSENIERVIISSDVTVFVGENARIAAYGELVPLSPAVIEQMIKGYYPVRLVYELAGYQVLYNQTYQDVSIIQ